MTPRGSINRLVWLALLTAAVLALVTAASIDVAFAAGEPAKASELKSSNVAAFLFWVFALATVGGSLFVVTRKNLIAAVMGMVGTFFAVAAVYVMLYAHFLAVIQVMVYAGAIMVLFVFVIMILNRPIEDPWSRQGLLVNGLAVGATGYILVRVSQVLWTVADPSPDPNWETIAGFGGATYPYGSTQALGHNLFTSYLFPFEAVSLVLLIAVVGAIAVARPDANRETLAEEGDANESPAG